MAGPHRVMRASGEIRFDKLADEGVPGQSRGGWTGVGRCRPWKLLAAHNNAQEKRRGHNVFER
jgi:hypothetical protein